MSAQIVFDQVTKAYDDKEIIRNLSFSIEKGEIFVLVGPSGSGKTSTLKMINGLSQPTSGTIYYKDQPLSVYDIRKVRWQIGYVLQQIALFPTMTVAQNIMVIPEMVGWTKEKQQQETDRLLTSVGLDPELYRRRMPSELSGGEQQRIGILRALAANPEVILMDEPFSALDPISRNELQELVLALHAKLGTTVVFVTHNMEEAIKLGDRIAVMKEGELLQVDTPEQLLTAPSESFINEFFQEQKAGSERDQPASQIGIYQTKISCLADRLLTDSSALQTRELPYCRLTDNLAQVFLLLAEFDGVAVLEDDSDGRNQQADGSVKGILTRQAVFAYLAEQE